MIVMTVIVFPASAMDPYKRDRTIRIGKWRWPPPKDATREESFYAFNTY